jgi:hypothetical protein
MDMWTILENRWVDIPDYVSIWINNIKEESYNMTNLILII